MLKFALVLEEKCACIWICGGTTYTIPVFKIGTKENAIRKSRGAAKLDAIKTLTCKIILQFYRLSGGK